MRGWQPGRVRRLLHADRLVLVVSLPARLLAMPRMGDVFAFSDNNCFSFGCAVMPPPGRLTGSGLPVEGTGPGLSPGLSPAAPGLPAAGVEAGQVGADLPERRRGGGVVGSLA
jgi:hypothetical protein